MQEILMRGPIRRPQPGFSNNISGILVCPHCGGRIPLAHGRAVEAFYDEQAAIAKLEQIVWPNGPVCPKCGEYHRVSRVTGKGARKGLLICLACRKQFRVTIGTVFEDSHIPIHKWFYACALHGSGKEPREICRVTGISYTSVCKIVETISAGHEIFRKIIDSLNPAV